ncbi:hypothetical protein Tco_0565725 [Tanacetum coccineum]
METIHVNFNELTAMASEYSYSKPKTNQFNIEESSAESTQTLSKEDVDNLFGPMYKEYFEKKSPELDRVHARRASSVLDAKHMGISSKTSRQKHNPGLSRPSVYKLKKGALYESSNKLYENGMSQYLGSTFNNYGTLKLDDSNDKFKSFIDIMEFKFSVDEFRRVFQLSQPTDKNHVEFVDPPTFIEMFPFFKNELGYNTPIRLLGQSVKRDCLNYADTQKDFLMMLNH